MAGTDVRVTQSDGGLRIELTGGKAMSLNADVLEQCLKSVSDCANSSGCLENCSDGSCAPNLSVSCLSALNSPDGCWQKLFQTA